jgi:hypothetical protein
LILWAGFSLLMMHNGGATALRIAVRRFQDASEHGRGAVLSAECTLAGRRAGRKPWERFGDGVHEESKPSK